MRSDRILTFLALAFLAPASMALTPGAAAAQPFPWFGGAEGRIGVASPEDATSGFAMTAEVDLGYVWIPPLRLVVGLNHFQADVDRASTQQGEFSATGGLAGLRMDFLPGGQLSPFLMAGLTWHNVSADVPENAELERLLDGAAAGATAGGGVRWRLTQDGRVGATLGVRQTWANNLDHTTIDVGLRFLVQGRRAYVRPEVQARSGPGLVR